MILMCSPSGEGSAAQEDPALREALQGWFTGHDAPLIGQMLVQIDFPTTTIGDPDPSGSRSSTLVFSR